VNREARADLAAWLGYLRDIGIRELLVASPGRVTPAMPAPQPARDRAATPAHAHSGDLFQISPARNRPEADPAQRLSEIRDDLGECTRCRLHAGRTNIVFGAGNPAAGLMFIGEGPGRDEDEQGEPFVGRAGQKLNEMIRAIGLTREEVYIANVVKCRPPENREPKPDEIATCSPFLFEQIEAIRPKVIVTLGSPATRTLLGIRSGITGIRGTWQSYRGIPVMPTYHPAYLLRSYTEENRRRVWDDLKAARARLDAGS
jgi:DNA polymerase